MLVEEAAFYRDAGTWMGARVALLATFGGSGGMGDAITTQYAGKGLLGCVT